MKTDTDVVRVRIKAVFTTLLLLITASCSLCTASSDIRSFFDTPLDYPRFRSLPLERQLEVLHYGMWCVHPPRLDLAGEIARRGKSVVPTLLEALTHTQEDCARADMILILADMVRLNLMEGYDIGRDETAIATLRNAVGTIQDRVAKSRAEEDFAEILARFPTPELAFFKQSFSQQRQLFRALSLEEQVKIYRTAFLRNSSVTDFAQEIAKQGQAALPVLLEAVRDENQDSLKVALLNIFWRMAPQYYDVARDKVVMTALTTMVSSLRDRKERKEAEEVLSQINTGQLEK